MLKAARLAPMSEAASRPTMSAAAYLAWEREQTAKHEFHHGEVFAMAGGSPRHNFLSTAIGAELRGALRGRDCRVLSSDQRLSVQDSQRYVYADAVVVCGPLRTEPDAGDVLVNPTVVVEVLSPRTEAYDRGDKWDGYRQLDSLTDYLLLSQAHARIEHYHREADGSWRYRVAESGGTIALLGGVRVSVDAVYDGAFEVPSGT